MLKIRVTELERKEMRERQRLKERERERESNLPSTDSLLGWARAKPGAGSVSSGPHIWMAGAQTLLLSFLVH